MIEEVKVGMRFKYVDDPSMYNELFDQGEVVDIQDICKNTVILSGRYANENFILVSGNRKVTLSLLRESFIPV